MKQKIITALKTKYQRFGLSNEAVDRIASAKEKTVTSEDEIDSAIADAETMELIANELQKSADKERRDRSNLQKSFDEYKEKHPEAKPLPDTPKEVDEEPEWAKKLREQQQAIAARFEAEDNAKKLNATREKVEAMLKADGCTNPGILKSVMKGFTVGKDETEDVIAERLKGEYDASYKETFGDGVPPGLSTNTFGDAKSAVAHKNEFLKSQGLIPKEK